MTAAIAAIARLLDVLRTIPDLTLEAGPLPTGQTGWLDHDLHTITLNDSDTPDEAAAALFHYLVQLDHGPGREQQALADELRTLAGYVPPELVSPRVPTVAPDSIASANGSTLHPSIRQQ